MVKNKTEDSKDIKSKILTAVVVIFLCLVFVIGFIWGLNSVLAMEGQFPPEKDTHGIFEEPKTNEEVIEMLNKAVSGVLAGKPKSFVSDEIGIDGNNFETDGGDMLKSSIEFAADGFEDTIGERLGKSETDFSQELKIRVPQITAADIESFECSYFAHNYIYSCDICDAESDKMLNGCPECGTTNLYVEEGRNEYVVKAVLKNSDAVLKNNFAPLSDEEIRQLLGDDFDGVLNIDNIGISYDNLEILFKINRETGELTYLEYKKDVTAKSAVTFTDKFESAGNANVNFKLTLKNKNEFTWPSLALNEEEMVIEPKKSDNLTATLICDDPTKPVVRWSSSNESVVSVDEEGYMKAGKNPGEAVVTAEFDFQGKTYSDSCLIKVRVPVESMKMSKRSIKLEIGSTKQLEAKVSPSDATIKSVKWFSENESIAKVDENGLVTAVSDGTVTVYAISDDEYYKSSCEVTVK